MASNKTIRAVEEVYKIVYTGESSPPDPGQWVLFLVNTDLLKSLSFDSDDVLVASNKITIVNHGLITGVRVTFTTDDTLPAPLATSTDYWIIKIDANEFRLASSYENALSNTPLTLTAAGSGNHGLLQSMVDSNDTIHQFVSIEVPATFGYSRKQVLFPTDQSFELGVNKVKSTAEVEVFADGGNIAFDGAVLLANGSLDHGDLSGIIWSTSDQDPRIIVDGSSFLFKVNAQSLTVPLSTIGLV